MDELADKVFYGFKVNPDTSHLDVDVIDGDRPIVLPQSDIIDPHDYKQWVFSNHALSFQWDKGHLQVRIL
jgi:hypothetical protein